VTQAVLASKSPRTQAERRDESQRRLLEAAAALIQERGMAAATFENIGARAGYSRGLATRHFGSKQGLIEALIARIQERRDGALNDGDKDGLSGLDAVLAFVDTYLDHLGSDGELRAYFITLASAVAEISELRRLFAEAHKGVEQRLEALILAGKAQGSVRSDIDADAAALMIGSLLFGLSMQRLLDPEMDLQPIRQVSLATLRLSLAPAEPTAATAPCSALGPG
jgi:AcrR family transcriptional regulator